MDRFIRCRALTKSGKQCKSGAMSLTPFCGVHQDQEHPDTKKSKDATQAKEDAWWDAIK